MRPILDFLAAWGGVLRDSLPAGVQRVLGLGRRFAVIEPSDDGWSVFQAQGATLVPQGGSTGGTEISDLADRLRQVEGSVVLVLPRDLAMRPALTLPGSAERSLDQVLDVEIERLTPFKAGDVTVAREIQPAADGQIRVDLTIVPHARIAALTGPLGEAGIRVDHVIADRERVERAPALGLTSPATGSADRSFAWAPALVTAVLIVVALASPFVAQEQRLRGQRSEIERLAPDLAAARRLARRVEATEAREQARQGFMQSRVSMTVLLEQVTRTLPDHTWLVSLQAADGRLTLEGRSSEATSLVTLLNAAPGLSDARFDAPVTRDPVTGADRFRLGATIDIPASIE